MASRHRIVCMYGLFCILFSILVFCICSQTQNVINVMDISNRTKSKDKTRCYKMSETHNLIDRYQVFQD